MSSDSSVSGKGALWCTRIPQCYREVYARVVKLRVIMNKTTKFSVLFVGVPLNGVGRKV